MKSFERRVPRVLALALVAVLVLAGVAIAGKPSKPVAGATYAGMIKRVTHFNGKTFRTSLSVSFKVSASGKQVSSFTFPQGYPLYCQGGGFGSPQARSAKVSKKGTFKVKLPLYFAPAHQHQGNLVVTGKFGAHGAESGKVTTAFTTSKVCNGTSAYKTKG